jgi:hypothetical protein
MKINSKRMIMVEVARGALLIASIMTAGCLEPDPLTDGTEGASLDEGEGRREDLVTTAPYAYPYGPHPWSTHMRSAAPTASPPRRAPTGM